MPDWVHGLRMERGLPCMVASNSDNDGCVCTLVTTANAALGDPWFIRFLTEAIPDVHEPGNSFSMENLSMEVRLIRYPVAIGITQDLDEQQSDSTEVAEVSQRFDADRDEILTEADLFHGQLRNLEDVFGDLTDRLRSEITQFENESSTNTLAKLKLATKADDIVRETLEHLKYAQNELESDSDFPWNKVAKTALMDLADEMGMDANAVAGFAKQEEQDFRE